MIINKAGDFQLKKVVKKENNANFNVTLKTTSDIKLKEASKTRFLLN